MIYENKTRVLNLKTNKLINIYMMKKSKLFGWALMALASLSACTDNAGDVLAGENEIRLTSEITPSRVTSLDYQSTQIVPGQEVGITITGAKAAHKNVAWRVGEDGELTNTGDPVFWANEDVVITAYHPYNSAWTGTSYDFSVSTDQSNEANYRNSDLLWGTIHGGNKIRGLLQALLWELQGAPRWALRFPQAHFRDFRVQFPQALQRRRLPCSSA